MAKHGKNGAQKYVLQSTWEADFVAIYHIGPDFVRFYMPSLFGQ